MGWNEKGLALGVEVQDDAVELTDPRVFWQDADRIEVFLDGSARRGDGYTPATLHLALLPRGGGPDGRGALAVAVHHEGDGLKGTVTGWDQVLVASNLAKVLAADNGAGPLRSRAKLAAPAWTVEVLIPWALVQASPRAEARVGFNLLVHRQGGAREDGMYLAILRGESGLDHPSTWGDLVLREAGDAAEAPPPPAAPVAGK